MTNRRLFLGGLATIPLINSTAVSVAPVREITVTAYGTVTDASMRARYVAYLIAKQNKLRPAIEVIRKTQRLS